MKSVSDLLDLFKNSSWDEFDQMRRDMIAESRLVWQKFDDEMKKLESRSFSRIGTGSQDKIEQGQGNINNTTTTEKDVINATTAKETEKHEKVSIKSSEINEQEKEKFRENEREIKTVVENKIINGNGKDNLMKVEN